MALDKLKAMRAFVQIVEDGSLTAAAATLRSSPPAVVRTLAALESGLGVRLLQRTTRRMSLTPEGTRYLAHCRDVLQAVADAEAGLSGLAGATGAPRGPLVVSAPVLFGEWHVAALVTRFVQAHPQVRCRLWLLDRKVDLVDEGVDVALRIGALADSSLVAVPLGQVRQVVVASPAFLRRHGSPRHPSALREAECVRVEGAAPTGWVFQEGGRRLRVPVDGRLEFNHVRPALQACEAGAGWGRFISYQVQPALAAGRLRQVLREFEPPPEPVHLVYPHARLLPARTRAFIEAARQDLAPLLAPERPRAVARPRQAT